MQFEEVKQLANGEDKIAQALRDGDVREARKAYDEYATSMEREGQKPKESKDLGIPQRY